MERSAVVIAITVVLAGCGFGSGGKPTVNDVQPAIVAMLTQGDTGEEGFRASFASVLRLNSVSIVDTSLEGASANVIATADVQSLTNKYISNSGLYGVYMWNPGQTLKLQFKVRLRKYDSGWRAE